LLTKHLDIDKTIHQLIIETENIVRQERKKKNEEYQDLKRLNAANEEELINRQNEIQTLQNESQQKQQRINTLEQKQQQVQLRMDLLEQKEQQTINEKELLKQLNGSLDQQLKDKIEASKQAFQLFELLVESKNNEIGLLKNDIQRLANLEQENHDLKRRLELLSSVDSNNTANDNNTSDTPSSIIRHDTTNDAIGDHITIKTEENELTPCQAGNKKRKVASSTT
jgi:chromosome segregation ATPase